MLRAYCLDGVVGREGLGGMRWGEYEECWSVLSEYVCTLWCMWSGGVFEYLSCMAWVNSSREINEAGG